MTTQDDVDEAYWKIEQCANEIMGLYQFFKKQSGGSCWAYAKERQCYRDCLESMKRQGLIKDYWLDDGGKIYME